MTPEARAERGRAYGRDRARCARVSVAEAERRREDERERREADQPGLGRDLQEVVVRVRAPVGLRMAVVVWPRRAPIAAEAEPEDRMRRGRCRGSRA